MSTRLESSFYQGEDVLKLSRQLLGKVLVTRFGGETCAGMITETEAYRAPDDKASHAFQNRRTPRTEVMFRPGGVAYIYLCYGIHHLFNVVTGGEGQAHVVLIRAIEPLDNLPMMLRRRGAAQVRPSLTAGPGALSQALGIHRQYSGTSLTDAGSDIWIEDRGFALADADIGSSPRIGVAYAGACAAWEWRFYVKNSPWVSKMK